MQEQIGSSASEAAEGFIEQHRCLPQDFVVPIPIMDPTKRREEHHKIVTVCRPKQDEKRAEVAKKRAAKRPKTEAAGDCKKVLGKRKVDFDQRDAEADVITDNMA